MKSLVRPRSSLMLTLCLMLGSVYVAAAHADEALPSDGGSYGLQTALEAAIKRSTTTTQTPQFTASEWLASVPTIDLTHLRSQEQAGNDETEIGVNLPLKSPFMREQDKTLSHLEDTLNDLSEQRKRLFYSGLVREAAWSAKIAKVKVEQTSEKIALLTELTQREQSLFEARTTNQYGLLLIKQALLQAQLEAADQKAEMQRWLNRFQSLTGMVTLPETLQEAPLDQDTSWTMHPDLRWLDATYQQIQALIHLGSNQSVPWNLRLSAKQITSPAFDEDQLGASIEIPIGMGHRIDQASGSSLADAARTYDKDRDELNDTLSKSWQQLKQTSNYLTQRQALLEASAEVSRELRQQASVLQAQNELGREIWINRLIADLERQSEVRINQILIEQNNAMRRQAAGIPL